MRYVRLIGWIAILLTFLLVRSAFAQDDPNFETGLKPYGSYHAGNIDIVDLLNQGLSIDIPLISYPQRGGKLKLAFSLHFVNAGYYYTVGYIYDDYGDVIGTTTDWENTTQIPGWTIRQDGIPVARIQTTWENNDPSTNNGYQSGSILMSDGAIHQMAPLSLNGPWRTTDASGFQVSGSQPTDTDPDGVTYTNGGYLFNGGGMGGLTAQTIQDTNGNTISTTPGTGTHINGWTDTMGRNISIPYAQTDLSRCPSVPSAPTSAAEWDLVGPNGASYPLLFCSGGSVPFSYYYYQANPQGYGTQEQSTGSGPVLQSLVLPDNTYWTFQYTTDGNQNLSQVTFPAGGNLCYTWNNPTINESAYFEQDHQVATRKLDPSTCGSNSPTWTYTIINGPATVVTDAAANDTVHSFTNIPNSSATLETETQSFNGSYTGGSWVKTVTTSYTSTSSTNSNIEPGAVPTQVSTSSPSGQSSYTSLSYDSPGFSAGQILTNPSSGQWEWVYVANAIYGQRVTKQDYDYGGSLLRTTNTAYQFQNNGNYLNANLLNLPASVQVTGSGPGSNTTFGYDESNCSSGACGNQTSVHRWVNDSTTATSNCTVSASNGYVVSYVNYNTDGTVASSVDSCGTSATDSNHMTAYAYSSPCYAGSGPTSVTNPLGQTTSYCYDSNTGLQISVTDPNNQTTSTSYDNMLRTSQITYPPQTLADNDTVSGVTTFSYPNANEVQISEQMDDQSHSRTWNLLVDGLGRLSQKQLTSDADGIDYTVTTYDGMGRVASVTNPYRSTSDPTYGVTSYTYDPLGRTQRVTEQDGSAITTDYSNFPCVTVTDEAGNTRQSCTDGLGRMTSVTENPGGLGYQTSYSYDVLDNLTGVTQVGSHQRSFVYDSLSRLTSATNPESGTTGYAYDNNGNVITKTDARNITTTYSYEQLNRLTSKTYNDGSTPAMYYSYDVAPSWMTDLTNITGRLVEASNQYGGTSGSGTATVYSYDAMGRPKREWQQTPLLAPGGDFTYQTYDLVGDLTSATDAAGHTFSYGRDTAGRVSAVTSSLVDPTHPATLWAADATMGYYPHGDIQKALFANGLYETSLYEARLQPCRLDVSTSGGIPSACDDTLLSGNVQHYHYTFGVWGSTNNGNVTNWVANGNNNFTRSYSYDPVNRLSTMSATDFSGCSGLSWSYDAWGNRNVQSPTGGTCPSFNQTADPNNHLPPPYQYDAAGNLTYDGSHSYTYDAENHLVKIDGGSTATYVYDALGHRVEKLTGGNTYDYFYDFSDTVTAEWQVVPGFSGWLAEYAYLGSRALAQYANATTYFFHQDHLGSTRLITGLAQADIRFTNASGNRSLAINSVTIDSNTIQPNDPSVSYEWPTCNEYANGVGQLDCNGDMLVAYPLINSASTVTVNAWGSPDLGAYPHMQLFVAGKLLGEWDVTGTAQNYSVSLGPFPLVAYRSDYYPFGEYIGSGTNSDVKFTGKERDDESGLDNFGARYLTSSYGRFMSPDPLNTLDLSHPQKLNRYSYANNSPLTNIDVNGNCAAPAVSKGEVGICVESYIRTFFIPGKKGVLALGDNRGPNPHGGSFRTQTLLGVNPVTHTVSILEKNAGWSCALTGCVPGINASAIGHVTHDDKGNTYFTLGVTGENGYEATGLPFAPKGTIKMQFTFEVDSNGQVHIIAAESTGYPSISVYSYDDRGDVESDWQQTESGHIKDLEGPLKPTNFHQSGEADDDAKRQCAMGNSAGCDNSWEASPSEDR